MAHTEAHVRRPAQLRGARPLLRRATDAGTNQMNSAARRLARRRSSSLSETTVDVTMLGGIIDMEAQLLLLRPKYVTE